MGQKKDAKKSSSSNIDIFGAIDKKDFFKIFQIIFLDMFGNKGKIDFFKVILNKCYFSRNVDVFRNMGNKRFPK